MRSLFTRYWLIALLVICLLPVIGVRAEGSSTVKFQLHGSDPVIAHHPWPAWDGRYTDPGAVVVHDGKFHMFRNGFKAWPATVQIGYAVSDDGLTWTEPSKDPVLKTAEVPFAGLAALASSAVVLDDGTWVLYFYTWETKTFPTRSAIGRATASQPEGPWKVDAMPVLTPGSAGSWDALQVMAPRVLRTENSFVMYYAGNNDNPQSSSHIGMATSPDGITWAKYNDPATTDAMFVESDPVLSPDVDHLSGLQMVHQPAVVQTPDGWVMVYRFNDPTLARPPMALGVATSSDGIHWTYDSSQRLWSAQQMPKRAGFWYTALAYNARTFYLYIEGETGTATDIYVATFTGQIKP